MRVYCGTSGYAYKEWKGSFYPEDLPAAKMLAYYAERFPTVEANNTYYRMPTAKQLEEWLQHVPAHFVFAIKASQRITHQARLKSCGELVKHLHSVCEALGDRFGPVLYQTPPNLKCDVALLKTFLGELPAHPCAFEFRHTSWFNDEVYAALKEKGAVLCIAESEKIETPLVATADWGYLKLRREDYTEKDVAAWADKIKMQKWSKAFVYFKHEDSGMGTKLAAKLQGILGLPQA